MDVHAFNRDKLLPNMSLIKPIIEKFSCWSVRILERGCYKEEESYLNHQDEIMNNVEKPLMN